MNLIIDFCKAMDDVLGRLRTAKGARIEHTPAKACSIGTREGVLKAIQGWATSTNSGGEHMFWLTGLAGTGKSTIATTIASWAREKGILRGSFCFARDVAEQSSPALVFPTLASQLARFDPRYERALYDALLADKHIASTSLASQFDGLILGPLSVCWGRPPILIILDALDECSPGVDVKEMLRILSQLDLGLREPKLRILVTSRPGAYTSSPPVTTPDVSSRPT